MSTLQPKKDSCFVELDFELTPKDYEDRCILIRKDEGRRIYVIQNWMRDRDAVEFLGLWEDLHKPNFNRVQFDAFKNEVA